MSVRVLMCVCVCVCVCVCARARVYVLYCTLLAQARAMKRVEAGNADDPAAEGEANVDGETTESQLPPLATQPMVSIGDIFKAAGTGYCLSCLNLFELAICVTCVTGSLTVPFFF